MSEHFCYYPGTLPVLVSIPHTATHVPPAILERFTGPAKRLPDTDWHVERLYGFAREMGAHMLVAAHSRYVVDLNRSPDNASLYPGRFTTGICPVTLFDGSPLYKEGQEVRAEEVQQRIETYWQPYHGKLQEVLAILGKQAGKVVLFDAHSICSVVPTLFDGALPDLNLGTADGVSADAGLLIALKRICEASGYSTACNGRFKGGYITRHYGNPAGGVHAVQLELTQKNYMQETHPFAYDELSATQLQKTLRELLRHIGNWLDN